MDKEILSLYESESFSVMSDSLWHHGLQSPWDSPGQNTGVGSLSLLQEMFPTQGLNPGLPHCRWILYQLPYKGSSRILEYVAYPFSSGSSRPRNWTGVSCIAVGFFTNWAMREARSIYTCLFKERLLRAAGMLSVGCIQLQVSSGLLQLQRTTCPRFRFFDSYLSPTTDWFGDMSISLGSEDKRNSHLGPTQYNSSVLVPEFPLGLAKTRWMHSLCFCQSNWCPSLLPFLSFFSPFFPIKALNTERIP